MAMEKQIQILCKHSLKLNKAAIAMLGGLILGLVPICCLGQPNEKIIYFIPNKIDTITVKYLEARIPNKQVFFVLSQQSDTTSTLICPLRKGPSELLFLIKNSNRFIKLGSTQLVPVLSQADLTISSPLSVTKKKGTAYEVVSKTLFTLSGYLLVYKGIYPEGKVVKQEYFQY